MTYGMNIYIPGTEYNESFFWNCNEGELDQSVKSSLKWQIERFAVAEGWKKKLFIENSDEALPVSEEAKKEYESIIKDYTLKAKYNVYMWIDGNDKPFTDLYKIDESINNINISQIKVSIGDDE